MLYTRRASQQSETFGNKESAYSSPPSMQDFVRELGRSLKALKDYLTTDEQRANFENVIEILGIKVTFSDADFNF